MSAPEPQIRRPDPVLLIVATFSRHRELLTWAQQQLQESYGSIYLSTEPFLFDHTSYYEASMGTELQKQLHAFEALVPTDSLPEKKHHAITLEEAVIRKESYPEDRPLNVDPGYLTLGKFLLASTKDHSHRVYLRDGIFAEVTLQYRNKQFLPWPWTYADYQQPLVLDFLTQARQYLYSRLRQSPTGVIYEIQEDDA